MKSAGGSAASPGVRQAPMSFTDRRGYCRQIVVGKHNPHNHGERFRKIKLFVGRKALEVT